MEEFVSIKETNKLFPIFLKLEELTVLLIGAGKVGLEKLTAILTNAPATKIKVVAKEVTPAFAELALSHTNVTLHITSYNSFYVNDADIVIAAVNDIELSKMIREDAKRKGKLINVADKPELCDFYLGSIVTKGNLKLAISTNGKSPTVAKRLREMFSELLPDEMEEVLQNLRQIRNKLKGDFTKKVERLNEITRVLVEEG